jgi:uncharacterized membrane protein
MASRAYASPAGRAHPVHGILSAFPLAFFTGALATDIIYAESTNMMWANFSVWQITFGLIGGVLAAVAGIVDAVVHRGRPRPRREGSALHNLLSIFALAFALVNVFVHSRDAWTSVVPTGLILSVVTVVLAVAASWLGFLVLARQGSR